MTATKIAGYVRVSTSEQAQHGKSLAVQERELRAYCELKNLEIVEIIRDEGVSAFKPLSDRPGGKRLLDLVKSKSVGAVCAARLDRLFRSAGNALQVTQSWRSAGVHLHMLDIAIDSSTAAGKVVLGVLAVVAQMERDLCSERIKSVLADKKRRGQFTGGTVPYGFRLLPGGLLEVDDDEMETIRLAHDLHAEGLSLRKIAAKLHEQGRTPKQSDRWHARTVQSLLRAQVRCDASCNQQAPSSARGGRGLAWNGPFLADSRTQLYRERPGTPTQIICQGRYGGAARMSAGRSFVMGAVHHDRFSSGTPAI